MQIAGIRESMNRLTEREKLSRGRLVISAPDQMQRARERYPNARIFSSDDPTVDFLAVLNGRAMFSVDGRIVAAIIE